MKTVTLPAWKLYTYIVIIIICTSFLSMTIPQRLAKWKDKQNRAVQLAHIYLDASSFPSLLQMLDLVQNEPVGPKLISWQRVVDTEPIKKEIKDVTLVEHIPYHLAEYWKNLENDLKNFLVKYPRAQFNVHVNKDQNTLVYMVLRFIPAKRINELHLYEEAFAQTISSNPPIYPSTEIALKVLQSPQRPDRFPNLALSLLPLYPNSVVHLARPDSSIELPAALSNHIGRIEEVNFEKIASQLTPKQKKKLLKLNGVNSKVLKAFRTKKPTVLYTTTFMRGQRSEDEKQINVLKQMLSANQKWLPSPQQYTWLYKGHPWHAKDTFLQDTIQANWPFVYQLPKQVPFEIFLLTGYVPDKVFGYSSALFFALPADRILFMIKRPGYDPYIPLLKKMNKLRDEQIVELDDFNVQP